MRELIKLFSGSKRIRIVCGDEGRFLTECVRRRIHISNIVRIDTVTYEFVISDMYYRELCFVASGQGCNLSVIEERSIYRWLKKYRRRKFFVAGFIVFLIIIAVRSSFISDITVTGNETIPSREILAQLDKVGFRTGIPRFGIDVRNICNNVMIEYSKLAWIWIDIHGTSANVSVKERVPKPEIENKSDFCNTIASRDALITELMPRSGMPVVRIGDTVKKGDVIISGIRETMSGEIRYMHADGIVRGRTWYEADGIYSHTRCDRYLTGRDTDFFSLTLGDNTYPVFRSDKPPYSAYDHKKKVQNLKFFKKTLPISFTIDSYCEIIEKYTEISDSEVISTAVDVLGNNLMNALKEKQGLTVIKKTHTYEKLSDGNIYVKVCFECSEDIGEYSPVVPPQYTENSEQEEQ